MEALCALLITHVAELWPMLPKHKSKRFHEFHAKADGLRWANMFYEDLVGYDASKGPYYHHESVVKCSPWMTEDNLCVFHFEGNRSKVLHNKYHGWYNASPWGSITVVVTKGLKLKTTYMKNPPPYPLDFHIKCNGYKEITQSEIDAEIAELVAIIEEWLSSVRLEVFQMRVREMKEELVAKAWAPERVVKWLEAGVALEAL